MHYTPNHCLLRLHCLRFCILVFVWFKALNSVLDQAFGFNLDSSFNCLTGESDWSIESRFHVHIIKLYRIINRVDLDATM